MEVIRMHGEKESVLLKVVMKRSHINPEARDKSAILNERR